MAESLQRQTVKTDHFGDRLVAAMQLRGNYKATALAVALNVNEAAVSRWKRNGPISLNHAIRLCDTLEVSMDWLIRGKGHPLLENWPIPKNANAATETVQVAVDEIRSLLVVIETQNLRGAQAIDLTAQRKSAHKSGN